MKPIITVKIVRTSLSLILGVGLGVTGLAQTPVGGTRRPEGQTARPARPVQVETGASAPQVVTILHRLNGLKVIRLLLRGNEQFGAIANLDEAFQMAGEVHTNVIAGLALSDGQTIAAWLPEAEAELPPPVPFTPVAPVPPVAPGSPAPKPAAPKAIAPLPPKTFKRTFATADVKIVTR